MARALAGDAIGPDTPLRLHVAAEIAFPDGSMTASGLRREIRRGRLRHELIAGKQYITLNYIQEMRLLCRDDQKGRASTCVNERGGKLSSSSSTGATKSARAAVLTIAEGLKGSCKPISHASTAPTGAAVIPLK